MIKKILLGIAKIIFLTLYLILYIPINLVKFAIKPNPIKLKVCGIISILATILSCVFFKLKGLKFVIIVLAAISFVASVYLVVKENSLSEKYGIKSPIRGLFDGLTDADAKAKYRQLMKENHPDNSETGDAEYAAQIVEEYNKFKKHS